MHTTASWAHGLGQLVHSLPGRTSAVDANLTVHHGILSSSLSCRLSETLAFWVLPLLQATGPIFQIREMRALVERAASERRKQMLWLLEFRWILVNPDFQQLRRFAPARGVGDTWGLVPVPALPSPKGPQHMKAFPTAVT